MTIWDFIYNQLSLDNRLILIVVTETKGSSPGRVGFKIAVSESGEFLGSIGGGIMEHNMVELARKKLRENSNEIFVKRQIHNPESEHDKSGMICSGEQTQVFIPLSKSDLKTFSSLYNSINEGRKGSLIINGKGASFLSDHHLEKSIVSRFENEENWEYAEQTGLTDTVYIFGAGHISLPLSQILRMLGFRVIVFDDRRDLSTYNANTFAHHKEVINYRFVSDLVPEGKDSYVAIMTFGHLSDDIVLRQMLRKKLKYLGMIGSKSKVQELFDRLRKEGFSEESLSFVNTPIGIPIGSQTPEEIAVSIAARIIQTRNSWSRFLSLRFCLSVSPFSYFFIFAQW